MLAHGRLLGILLCGERAGGEAYVRDEIEALSEFAHGVGASLGSMIRFDAADAHDGAILRELRELREAVARLEARYR